MSLSDISESSDQIVFDVLFRTHGLNVRLIPLVCGRTDREEHAGLGKLQGWGRHLASCMPG